MQLEGKLGLLYKKFTCTLYIGQNQIKGAIDEQGKTKAC